MRREVERCHRFSKVNDGREGRNSKKVKRRGEFERYI